MVEYMEVNTTPSPPRSPSQRSTLVIFVIIGVAVIAAGLAILVANNQTAVTSTGYQGMQFSRQPDGGFVLGNPDARITVVEWADYA